MSAFATKVQIITIPCQKSSSTEVQHDHQLIPSANGICWRHVGPNQSTTHATTTHGGILGGLTTCDRVSTPGGHTQIHDALALTVSKIMKPAGNSTSNICAHNGHELCSM